MTLVLYGCFAERIVFDMETNALRRFSSFHEAEQASDQDVRELTVAERLDAFMTMMEPYYAAAGRLQRVYRTDDLLERRVRDDWRLCVQPISESTDDGGH